MTSSIGQGASKNFTGSSQPLGSQWRLVKVAGKKNGVRIQNLVTGEFLYAGADDLAKDPERRRVFTWTDTTTTPESNPSFWDGSADWEVAEEELGFTLRNSKFGEYLYAAADDRALSEDQRSVFTWKVYETLGVEGYWKFGDDLRKFLADSNGQSTADGDIVNVRYGEPLLNGPLFNSERRNVAVNRKRSF
jgi:hypothetical protein